MIDAMQPRLSRRELLLGAAAAAATAPVWRRALAAHSADRARGALQGAADWLWSQQGDDGGWHSPQYGLMRSGQSLTPFVLCALLDTPESIAARPAGGVKRALAFIRQRVDDAGSLGHADPDFTEYPVYSTSYALLAMTRAGSDGDAKLAWRMQEYLGAAQFGPGNGFEESHPAYGGWGVDKPLAPGKPGHMDLAHTRRALEALAAANRRWPAYADFSVNIAQRAAQFLAVVQKLPHLRPKGSNTTQEGAASYEPFDGGFYFSPVVVEANKSERQESPFPHSHSYATATCDGILALRAAGARWQDDTPGHKFRDDLRLSAAEAWLRRYDDVDYPQGVLRDPSRPWGEAIRFYHYAVRAEAYRALDFQAAERTRLAAAVVKHRRPDGSFVNRASTLMKEDCPVMCTALAATALAHALA